MQKLLIRISVLSLISLVLAGCASTKEAVLPQNGPSMKAIYEKQIETMNAGDPQVLRQAVNQRPLKSGKTALHGYTRDANNEIEILFPTLPNPTLVMYIFPHLSGENAVPVPGYATAFPMYEHTEYALPGEVATPIGE